MRFDMREDKLQINTIDKFIYDISKYKIYETE